jgi:hypothetical protein
MRMFVRQPSTSFCTELRAACTRAQRANESLAALLQRLYTNVSASVPRTIRQRA